ncbi:hypothetical protein OE88DRAFT_1647018 [Heliocybe sulcata]|uniref:Uncharacterized protein n=1 Tax=Heliocybe sulcata TaxID=5364 RepID=A0A5C3MTZ9_9AGAM|nr:hypothetical protein OE88DRAFT_1647018 [Heliocybe sulcata]
MFYDVMSLALSESSMPTRKSGRKSTPNTRLGTMPRKAVHQDVTERVQVSEDGQGQSGTEEEVSMKTPARKVAGVRKTPVKKKLSKVKSVAVVESSDEDQEVRDITDLDAVVLDEALEDKSVLEEDVLIVKDKKASNVSPGPKARAAKSSFPMPTQLIHGTPKRKERGESKVTFLDEKIAIKGNKRTIPNSDSDVEVVTSDIKSLGGSKAVDSAFSKPKTSPKKSVPKRWKINTPVTFQTTSATPSRTQQKLTTAVEPVTPTPKSNKRSRVLDVLDVDPEDSDDGSDGDARDQVKCAPEDEGSEADVLTGIDVNANQAEEEGDEEEEEEEVKSQSGSDQEDDDRPKKIHRSADDTPPKIIRRLTPEASTPVTPADVSSQAVPESPGSDTEEDPTLDSLLVDPDLEHTYKALPRLRHIVELHPYGTYRTNNNEGRAFFGGYRYFFKCHNLPPCQLKAPQRRSDPVCAHVLQNLQFVESAIVFVQKNTAVINLSRISPGILSLSRANSPYVCIQGSASPALCVSTILVKESHIQRPIARGPVQLKYISGLLHAVELERWCSVLGTVYNQLEGIVARMFGGAIQFSTNASPASVRDEGPSTPAISTDAPVSVFSPVKARPTLAGSSRASGVAEASGGANLDAEDKVPIYDARLGRVDKPLNWARWIDRLDKVGLPMYSSDEIRYGSVAMIFVFSRLSNIQYYVAYLPQMDAIRTNLHRQNPDCVLFLFLGIGLRPSGKFTGN